MGILGLYTGAVSTKMKMERKTPFKLFGRFLVEHGTITQEDLFFARALQRKKNKKVGEIAAELDLMTPEEVEYVLIKQEDDGLLFGEIAISEGIITEDEFSMILKKQEEGHIYIGEALVEIKAITNKTLIEELKAYNFEKLKYAKKMQMGA